MTNADTHQELERNTKPIAHEHAGDEFCIRCITTALFHEDFRYDVALVAATDLRRLATFRAAIDHVESWRDRWDDVLDPQRLAADLESDDVALRRAAKRAKESVGDFLVYQRAAFKTVTIQSALRLMELEQRVAERITEIDGEAGPFECPN